MTLSGLDFLKVARLLLFEWTWHERLLSLAARQIYRRNFPPVALSNQNQRFESTRQSSQIITRSRAKLFEYFGLRPRTSKFLALITRSFNDAICVWVAKSKVQRCPRTSAQSNRKSLLWKGRVFIGAYRMIGKKSLTFEVTPFVFDFLRHGERKEVMSVWLVPVKRTSINIKSRSIGILWLILTEL